MRCEYHTDCDDPAVAKVGLPGKRAVWACVRGFNQFVAGVDDDKAKERISMFSDFRHGMLWYFFAAIRKKIARR